MGVAMDTAPVRIARLADTVDFVRRFFAGETLETADQTGSTITAAGFKGQPLPVQAGGPPIMIGGNSALARRRAITSARGWIPADFDLDATRAARDAIDRDLKEIERPAALGPFDFTVISPKNRLDRELVDGYRELGVDRLIVLPGLDVPTERRYHSVPIDDIFRTIDHLTELAQE
jgi:alkanesulfonate monooxygenase SsuD/methylene tetrahydromethanopterin reductase-like flavin-dependent oxidoreductase (luciferase family)